MHRSNRGSNQIFRQILTLSPDPRLDLYAENILDHFKSPRGKEPLEKPTVSHHEINASCGDELTVNLKIENDIITRLSWSGTGCAISQAAMSMLSEELTGMNVKDIEVMKPEHIKELLGVPVGMRRIKCALLCLHALKNALRKNAGKKPQSWVETVGTEN